MRRLVMFKIKKFKRSHKEKYLHFFFPPLSYELRYTIFFIKFWGFCLSEPHCVKIRMKPVAVSSRTQSFYGTFAVAFTFVSAKWKLRSILFSACLKYAFRKCIISRIKRMECKNYIIIIIWSGVLFAVHYFIVKALLIIAERL